MAEILPFAAAVAGDLHVPADAHGIVVVVEREGVREPTIGEALHEAHFATLRIRVDAAADPAAGRAMARWLTDQLVTTAGWIGGQSELSHMPVGIFGADLAGGAALAAAAVRPDIFRALVIHDGRPHLAGFLDEVRAATLLIVDAQDDGSIATNQEAMTRVRGIAELEILPSSPVGADDPETAAAVARLARRWFGRFLA